MEIIGNEVEICLQRAGAENSSVADRYSYIQYILIIGELKCSVERGFIKVID